MQFELFNHIQPNRQKLTYTNTVCKPKKLLQLRVPYMGSKNAIAEQLMDKMLEVKPKAKYFFDIFAGGGSMSFTAMQYGLKTIYNEKQTSLVELIRLIFDRIKNNEKSEYGLLPAEYYQFVSREVFKEQLKLQTPFAQFCRICYSFGNKQTSYAFSPKLETFKKHGHNFVIFKDTEAKQYIKEHYKTSCNQFIDYIETGNTWQDRRLLFVNIILKIESIMIAEKSYKGFVDFFNHMSQEEFYKMSQKHIVNLINEYIPDIDKKVYKLKRTKELQGYKSENHNENLGHLTRLEKLSELKALVGLDIKQQLERLEQLEGLQRLEQLERLERLEQLEGLQQLEQLEQLEGLQQLDILTILNQDYKDVVVDTPIDETIVYLDPPYRNTAKYIENDTLHTDIDDYFKNSPYSCFMSEYDAPHKSIMQLSKVSNLASDRTVKKYVIENLFYNEK